MHPQEADQELANLLQGELTPNAPLIAQLVPQVPQDHQVMRVMPFLPHQVTTTGSHSHDVNGLRWLSVNCLKASQDDLKLRLFVCLEPGYSDFVKTPHIE